MSATPARQRIDLWLYRARFAKTRAAAARLVAEGGVRLVHNGVPRRLEKPSVEVAAGDMLLLPLGSGLRMIVVEAVPTRRGPASEARTLYSERDAEALA
jgi:ribosome-associated heat shock protein Hsp15